MRKTKLIAMLAILVSAVAGCNNNVSSALSTNSTSSTGGVVNSTTSTSTNISTSTSTSTSTNNNISSSSTSSNDATIDINTDSYYDAMLTLKNLKNYTIKVTFSEGSYRMTNNVYFTENAIFDDYVGDEYGYLLTDEGVIFVDYYENELVGSEVILKEDGTGYDTVWDKTFFSSFADINVEDFKDAGNDIYFDITGKVNKIQLMNMVHAQQTDYDKLIAVTAYLGDTLEDLMFTLEFEDNFGYSIEIMNINSTKIDVIDKYVAAGKGAAKVCDDLIRVRNLFAGFNYKRVIYYQAENEEIKVAGYEYFNPDYFMSRFTDEYKLIDYTVMLDSGYIGFDHKIVEGMELHGAYYTYIYEGQASIFPQAAYHDPDITKFYAYPTYLSLFKNFQYFTKVEGSEHSYRTTNFDLNLEFIENMQVAETLAGFYLDGLTITLEDAPEDEDAKVIFTIEYSTDGVVGGENSATAEFEFIDFGMANIMELDLILASATDAR